MYIYVPLYTYIYISFRAIPAYNIKSIKSGEIAKKLIKTTSNTHTHTKKKTKTTEVCSVGRSTRAMQQ